MGSLGPNEIFLIIVVGVVGLVQLAGWLGGILYLARLIRERQQASRRQPGVAE